MKKIAVLASLIAASCFGMEGKKMFHLTATSSSDSTKQDTIWFYTFPKEKITSFQQKARNNNNNSPIASTIEYLKKADTGKTLSGIQRNIGKALLKKALESAGGTYISIDSQESFSAMEIRRLKDGKKTLSIESPDNASSGKAFKDYYLEKEHVNTLIEFFKLKKTKKESNDNSNND